MEYGYYRFNGEITIKFAPKNYKRFHLLIDHIYATGIKHVIKKIKEHVAANYIEPNESFEYVFVPEGAIESRPTNIRCY